MPNRIWNFIFNAYVNFVRLPASARLDVPYFSQWESIELVDDILSHKIAAGDDPKWKQSGALSPSDYQLWSWNLCGTACLKMILRSRRNKDYKLLDLAKKISEYGGYKPKSDRTIDGLYYRPFVTYVRREHSMEAMVASPLTMKRIKYELARGNFVIASVHQSVRNAGAPTPRVKSGHLVLLTGYNDALEEFYIHNPSGYYGKSQINYPVPYSDFARFFSGRGMVVAA